MSIHIDLTYLNQYIIKSGYHILLVAIGSIFFAGCTCEDCGTPLEKEPYVRINFFQMSNLSSANVVVHTFNGQDATEISYFQDTTNEYVLPLSMHSDLSEIILTYASSSDFETEYSDTLLIEYDREFLTNPENYVLVIGLGTSVLEHTLDSLAFTCKDTLGICNSNESKIKAYF